MILDVHAHVGKPNYAYRAAEFTRANLLARMTASDIARCCVFSFYDVQDNDYVSQSVQGGDELIPFAFINPKVPGAADREHPVLAGAGHFLQEDAGDELGRVVAAFMG